jgi:hypothetical protein
VELIDGADNSNLLACNTIKSYVHASAMNEMSDKNDGDNKG